MTRPSPLARYKVLQELRRDATGALYSARDRETGADIGLKRLDPALSGTPGATNAGRVLKRARSARLLRHPSIVAVHDAFEVAGTAYVAMELLEGESLRRILDAGPLPVARAIRIARDIANGLAHAHLQGVVHGELNPSSIVVLPSGAAKIADFWAPPSGAPGAGYVSPEQARGEPFDHRCDIFSLGALLYEMLAGRAPAAGDPPPPSKFNELVPRALDGIVMRMLAAQPAARTPGAPVVVHELQRLEEALGLEFPPVAVSEDPPPRATPVQETFAAPNRTPDPKPFDYDAFIATMEREARRERYSGSRSSTFATLAALLAVVGIGAAGLMYYWPELGRAALAAMRMPEKWGTEPAASYPTPPPRAAARGDVAQPESTVPAPNPEPPTENVAATETESVAATNPVQEPAPPAPTPEPEVLAVRAPEPPVGQNQAPPAAPTQEPAKPQPAGTAKLIIAVSPRGEIYIDGKHHGTTPPVTTLDLEPGMHRVEVRNGSRKPYLTYMIVQAGDVRRIRHEFDAVRSAPPRRTASWKSRE